MSFSKVDPQADFPALEREVLQFWADRGIFQKRRDMNVVKPTWSFLDGPITANNPMGVHHAWGRTYKDVFNQELGVMDATAITMAMEHDLPILVFDFKKPGNFARAVSGEGIGTLISRAPDA